MILALSESELDMPEGEVDLASGRLLRLVWFVLDFSKLCAYIWTLSNAFTFILEEPIKLCGFNRFFGFVGTNGTYS